MRFFLFYLFIVNVYANSVVDIRLNKNNNTQRIVIDNTNKINYNTFLLQNPSRLVIDLQNTDFNAIKAPSFQSNDLIYTLRVGKFSNTDSRIVFDLNVKPQKLNSFYLKADNDNKNHRIVIDLDFDSKSIEQEDLISKLIENNIDNFEKSDDSIGSLIDKLEKEHNTPKNLAYKPKNVTVKSKPRIVIDAGHGGKDSGAVGLKGTMEKILALIYAKDLKVALEKTGKYNVYLTRNADFYIDLQERVNIARRLKGDLFISIHANSSMNHAANGLSIYILSQKASDTRTAKLAERENKSSIISGHNLYGEYQYTINTLVDISRIKAMNDSKKFSKIFEGELRSRGVKSHGANMVKSANFAVLTSASMPSILLELGFISNVQEEKMIRSSRYKNTIVNSLIKTLEKYFK